MTFSPWSTLKAVTALKPPPTSWVPPEEGERIAAYAKYEEMYWNDPHQYALRVLEGEEPVYVPNARVVVDTTSHYFMKGLRVFCNAEHSKLSSALKAFLDRELFYSRFQAAKHSGVVKGDFLFHLTANPLKPEKTRLSLNSVDPARVYPIYDEDIPDKMIACHLIDIWREIDGTEYVKKLTYRLVELEGLRRVSREEAIYELYPTWYGPEPRLKKVLLPYALLDEKIRSIPIYWFKNIDWEGWLYGVSELKGLEGLLKSVSQSSTDVQGALSLEGLGVYATDGGRPVDDNGNETDWELSPGKVMEVPSGSYFRRVEGLTSITPATDQIDYLEGKINEASSLTDVARGEVDVQIAQSGIALAIRFLPTLAKMEQRDLAGVGKLKQLFYDWVIWHEVFEFELLEGEVLVEIGDKLPSNRTERLNELNNMLDRKVISAQYYRDQMQKLGYVFPEEIADQILEEQQAKIEVLPQALPDTNQSNNANKVNESNGTEATA